MSTAELKELRKEAKKYIDHADERVVKMVYAMLEADTESDKAAIHLTPEQEAELERRMELDKKGLMKYSTWEEARKRVIQKGKK
jgi:hypothetical protein